MKFDWGVAVIFLLIGMGACFYAINLEMRVLEAKSPCKEQERQIQEYKLLIRQWIKNGGDE